MIPLPSLNDDKVELKAIGAPCRSGSCPAGPRTYGRQVQAGQDLFKLPGLVFGQILGFDLAPQDGAGDSSASLKFNAQVAPYPASPNPPAA